MLVLRNLNTACEEPSVAALAPDLEGACAEIIMADWFEALREQADLISRLATDVPPILNDPNLTPERARRVYQLVESGAQQFDVLVAKMDRDNAVPNAQMRTAERLMDVWSNLWVLTTNKVRAMDVSVRG